MVEGEGVPTEELIRSGEITGRSALEYLNTTGQYVFHGSPDLLSELEPRQALSHGQPDGEPAVCAATNLDQAIFRAIVHRKRDETAGYHNHYSAWSSNGEVRTFMALRSSLEAAEGVEGYVYALSKEPFSLYRNEMRATEAIVPDFTVVVRSEDLPGSIRVFDSVDEMREYQKSLKIG